MAAVGAIGGVVYYSSDGIPYSVRGDVKIRWGGMVREPVTGADGQDHGDTIKPTPQGFDLTISDSGQLTLGGLQAIVGQTATIELVNGKVYVGQNTRNIGELELDAIEGKVPAKFACSQLIEVPVTS